MVESDPSVSGKLAGAVAGGATLRTPKTVLGFFGISLSILAAATSGIVFALTRSPELFPLIPYVLGFFGVSFFSVIAGIFTITWRDPAKLQLGQVSADIYLQHIRLLQGDNEAGEVAEDVIVVKPALDQKMLPGATPSAVALPALPTDVVEGG